MARGAIGVEMRFKTATEKLEQSVQKGAIKSLAHGLATVRLHVLASMVPAKGPSDPGEPPHVHRGRLQRAILFAIDRERQEGFVGPAYSRIKSGGLPPWVASMHERGGTYGGGKWRKAAKTKTGKARKAATYPARPYMAPALEATEERFVRGWKGSIS